MRAVHTVAGLAPEHGGPSYSVPRVCRALTALGVSVDLESVVSPGEAPRRLTEAGFTTTYHRQDMTAAPGLGGLRLSGDLRRALETAATGAEVMHSHGLWLAPNLYAARAARHARRPHVISPRGMLGPGALQFSRLKKRAFWRLAQGSAVRSAACLHATSDLELDDIRAFGLTNPVAVIPNGIDIGAPAAPCSAPERVVLSLGRVHPKKGLDRLIRAWALVEADHPAWRLRIVGPAELGHDLELRALADELKLSRVSVE